VISLKRRSLATLPARQSRYRTRAYWPTLSRSASIAMIISVVAIQRVALGARAALRRSWQSPALLRETISPRKRR
jgi:hypothetical protein